MQKAMRLGAPAMPAGELRLPTPPRLQVREGMSQSLLTAIPMLGSVGAVVVLTGTSGAGNGRGLVTAGIFLFGAVAFVVVQFDRQRNQHREQVSRSRSSYLRHLAQLRAAVRSAADQQRAALSWRYPPPAALPALAEEGSRIWELEPDDEGFLHARVGLARQRLAVQLVTPDAMSVEEGDPVAAAALRRFLGVHRAQPELPAPIDLRAWRRLGLTGAEESSRSLARAILCSATAFHSPTHLAVAVLTTQGRLRHWEWLKWLPHAWSARESDAVGPRRMIASSPEGLAALLSTDGPAAPHLLLVIDGCEVPSGSALGRPEGITIIELEAPPDQRGDPDRLRLPLDGTADRCDVATAEAFARRLAPLAPDLGQARAGSRDFMALMGLGDLASFVPDATWHPRRDRLRVPIGVSHDGSTIHLDLKESAQGGMGPHGLLVGATGSGKSEFLRTLVLGLAMTHSPEQLNLVLVDFKGGATFAGMSEMPHVSALITNLAEELTLVDRMQDSLSGEMVRRQELLRAAGNFASIRDYERARAAGEKLAPLPSLLIVVDEFSEMLSAKPEFIDLFVAIGRLGRSLGLHLLLASQRLEEGRLRGLESHLSYRVGLRTFSASESRAVLGVPDAYELPAVPGIGYLKPDQATLLRFKAAYVSGPASERGRVRRVEGGQVRGILPFTVDEVPSLDSDDEPQPIPVPGPLPGEPRSLLDVAVARMAGHGPVAHQVWLPPLDRPDTLDDLLPDLVEDPGLGLVSPQWRARGGLTIPVGTVDRPREQRRDTLTVSLSGAAGHAAVVGGPRSGKSTLLRTMVASLSLCTTPDEIQFYVLDFGGGTFAPLAGLPHVAGVGTRSEPDVVRRVVAEVRGIVDRRESYFRANGIDSIETYRARRAEGRSDDGYGDVFLVVDGWSTLRADFDDLALEVQALAQRGLTFGAHLLVSATRWADLRSAMRDVFGTRLELRLGDPLDSEVDRRMAQLVPVGRPGRGLLPSRAHFLGALPRIDGRAEPSTLGDGVEALVRRSAAAWTGPRAPKLRLLPGRISLEQLHAQAQELGTDDDLLLLGINEKELAPVGLSIDTEPHLLVFGDGQSGKSSLLRGLVQEIARNRTSKEAQIIAVDYRRSLLGDIPADYRLDHLTSAAQAGPAMKELADHLASRLPGSDVTVEQLRSRSWWTGADVWALVDDYDLVATQAGSPLAPLAPLLAQARDIGLHLVVTRRSGGASRAMYEPVIQTLRDLAMPGLLLSGSSEEGALLGSVRPTPQPPGRGRLITRDRGIEVVQLAWTDPAH